jgi:subtilisin family serine protease
MRKWLAVGIAFVLMLSFAAVSVSAAPSNTAYNYTVVFKADQLPANAADVVAQAGGTVLSSVPALGVMYVSGPVSVLNGLNSNTAVLSVSPSIELKLPKAQVADAAVDAVNTAAADLYNRYQWDIKQMTNNGASYALGSGSHNTVVGVIDTGVSTQHLALKANLLGGKNYVPDGPGGTVVPTDIEDKNGHGSHTAGNIAGNGRILGIAPNVGFRSYRVFGATGGSPSDRIINAIIDATNDGVDVISMSIGGYDTLAQYTWTDPATGIVYKGKDVADFVAYKRAVQYAVQHGVVVVAAAGNEATNTANPVAVTAYLNAEYGSQGYAFQGASREVPGTLPGVVTVSATGPDKSLASYSNYGPGAIDLSAPGGDFQRYPAPDYYLDMSLSSYKNGGYVWMAGTSMATPKVAAVAALIIDQAKANGQTLNPAQVVTKLQQTSVDIGKLGYDPYFGYGMANAYSALGGN